MGVLFHCGECNRPLNVGDEFSGRPGVCPNCQRTIQVPAESEIQPTDFRRLLNEWAAQERQSDLPVESAAPASTVVAPPQIETNHRSHQSRNRVADSPVQVVTQEPVDIGGLYDETKDFSSDEIDPLLTSSKAVWFIRPASGGQFGPASSSLLRQWIGEGRVTGDSWVWCEGWDNWQEAGHVFPNIASKISKEAIVEANTDQVTAARTRTAYMKARKRRTMRNVIAMIVGSLIIIGLIVALIVVVRNQTAHHWLFSLPVSPYC